MQKTVMKWVILVLLVAYAVGMVFVARAHYSGMRCSGIEVFEGESSHPVDSDTYRGVVDELMSINPKLLNTPVEHINVHAIEKRLRRLSNFESVECVITQHGKLRIYTVPVVPEVRVFDGNDSYYINCEGKRIAANANFFEDVPIVSGKFSDKFPAKSLLPVVRHIQRDSLLRHLVTMVSANDPNNIILIPCIKGHVINIGDTTDLDYKFRNLLAMYRKVMPHRGWNTYDTISVKFRGQVVATRADKENGLHTNLYEEEADLEEATLPADETSPHLHVDDQPGN